ncbi:MAG: hypothetical protein ACRDMZ_09635, partial [Solirubrobacteraceae bacterium]
RMRFALEAAERLHANVLKAALGRSLEELWAGTVGLCDPRRDIRELRRGLDLVCASPAAQTALALPSILSRELPARNGRSLDAYAAQVDALGARALRWTRDIRAVLREGLLLFEQRGADTRASQGPRMVALLESLPQLVGAYFEEVACSSPT